MINNNSKVFCLFEQSGTFKNEFIKLGIHAEDYDILNDFGQTDNIVDLFAEIKGGYDGKPSLFDQVQPNDLIMAFFPCIRFENQILLHFRGQASQMKNYTTTQKMEKCVQLQTELTEMYELVNKLFIICINRGLKLIMENPYSDQHYLQRYWCLQPSIIDHDRRQRGDYYKKPTQYWFVNCEPQGNFIFEAQANNGLQVKDANRMMSASVWEQETGIKCSEKVARSMIHPDYANRFIREHILHNEEELFNEQ